MMRSPLISRNISIARDVISGQTCKSVGVKHDISVSRVAQLTWRITRMIRGTHLAHNVYLYGSDIKSLRKNKSYWLDALTNLEDR